MNRYAEIAERIVTEHEAASLVELAYSDAVLEYWNGMAEVTGTVDYKAHWSQVDLSVERGPDGSYIDEIQCDWKLPKLGISEEDLRGLAIKNLEKKHGHSAYDIFDSIDRFREESILDRVLKQNNKLGIDVVMKSDVGEFTIEGILRFRHIGRYIQTDIVIDEDKLEKKVIKILEK